MRVLLINPEFPSSFWSLQHSCELLGRKTLMAPLGLLTLAALLPGDWELRLADLNVRPLSPGDWDWAELVMLTGMIVQREELVSLIREAKARRKTVVVGGPFATSVPQDILEAGADFLVRGEGEITIPLWLAAWRAGETHGVIEPDGRPEMTISPVPRFDLVNQDDYVIMGIQTSRGCPFNCEFCDIINLYGRKPRYKTPDQVLAELETLYNLGGGEKSLSATIISSATGPMPGPSSRNSFPGCKATGSRSVSGPRRPPTSGKICPWWTC